MKIEKYTWQESESEPLTEGKNLNLVQITNFLRVHDFPKVTLKISNKAGTRIQVSLLLGQSSPPDSCLSSAYVLESTVLLEN